MPGLMATREEFGKQQPLKGARIAGSLHMTIQTAVLIETLKALGADVRWVSCNIYSTQDHAAAAIAAARHPVFAIKGESLEDYWDYTLRLFEWGDGGMPNMILDDGGDATLLVHLGVRAEGGDTEVPRQARAPRREEVLFALDQEDAEGASPRAGSASSPRPSRASRGDHHGRAPALRDAEEGHAAVARHQRQRQRHASRSSTTSTAAARSLVDGIRRGTDVMMAGKVAMVAGYGDVGKGSAASLSAGRLPRDGARRSTRSAPCRRRWRATRSSPWRMPRRAPTSSSPPPATRTSSRIEHMRAHEGPRHRLQHRPLRQRDPGRRPQEPQVEQHQAAGRRDRRSPTASASSCCPRAAW